MSPQRSIRTSQITLLLLLVLVSGCLPSACQRRESKALFPADSVSRQLAEFTPIDTLSLVWETTGDSDKPLQYPRTVRFGSDSTIYVSDVQNNVIYEFYADGILNRTHESPLFSFPYLVGVQGDTLLVLNPDEQRIDFMHDERSVFQIATPSEVPENQRLQYAVVEEDQIYYKVIGEKFDGYIAKLDLAGNIIQKTSLDGPLWRHAGMLRIWDDALISLCAYRPVADIVMPGGAMDTLQLAGFDSPMLSRSRSFMLGDIDEPPLLSPSAAVAGDMLFALNIRPGWLRIDQFNKEGALEKRLVQDMPSFSKAFYPIDLDVRIVADSTVELAVLYIEPEPKVSLYQFSLHE